MAREKRKLVIAESDTLVDTLKKHVSFDGIYRVPGSGVSRYIIPKGKSIPRHVIVIEDKEVADPEGEGTEASDVDFEALKPAGKLKAIAECKDAETLACWGMNVKEDSKEYKAIADRILELELGGSE